MQEVDAEWEPPHAAAQAPEDLPDLGRGLPAEEVGSGLSFGKKKERTLER